METQRQAGSSLTDGLEHPNGESRDKLTQAPKATNLYVVSDIRVKAHPISSASVSFVIQLTDRASDYAPNGDLTNARYPLQGASTGQDFLNLNDSPTLDGESWGAATVRVISEEAKRLGLVDADAVATNEPTETAAQSRLE